MPRDLDLVADVLRRTLPMGHDVAGVSPLTTGFSNDTYRIDDAGLILRLPPAAGAMLDGHDVVQQARIYHALSTIADAPPVPRIVHIEESAEQLGAPFFVMECVPGESIDDLAMRPWLVEGTDEFRTTICQDWVRAFAALARLAPLDVLGDAITPEDDARRWRAFATAAGAHDLAGLFDRLLAVPAVRSGPPSVVHGDTKLSNLMWDDGRISAVLDWEMALNGEPLADLGYMLYSFESEFHAATRAQKLPGMLKRADVIDVWAKVSGRSPEGLYWYEIAQIGKIAAIIAEGVAMYNSGRSTDPKLEQFAQVSDYYNRVMEAMLAGHSL